MAFWDNEELIDVVDKNKSEKIEISWAEKAAKQYIVYSVTKKYKDNEEYKHTGQTVSIPVGKFLDTHQKVMDKILEKNPTPAETL